MSLRAWELSQTLKLQVPRVRNGSLARMASLATSSAVALVTAKYGGLHRGRMGLVARNGSLAKTASLATSVALALDIVKPGGRRPKRMLPEIRILSPTFDSSACATSVLCSWAVLIWYVKDHRPLASPDQNIPHVCGRESFLYRRNLATCSLFHRLD